MYKPDLPYNTPVELLNITEVKTVRGVDIPQYSKTDDIFCKFRTYGGTESTSNGVLTVEDTANVETWYRPDITASSRIKLNNKVYEVMGEPENIEQRNQIIKFKVRSVRGGT